MSRTDCERGRPQQSWAGERAIRCPEREIHAIVTYGKSRFRPNIARTIRNVEVNRSCGITYANVTTEFGISLTDTRSLNGLSLRQFGQGSLAIVVRNVSNSIRRVFADNVHR